MKMTKLKEPSVLAGKKFEPWKIVDDESTDSRSGFGRKRRKDFLPLRRSLFAAQQNRIEEKRRLAVAGFQRGQKKNPSLVFEIEPEPIGQKNEVALRDSSRHRFGDNPAHCLPESIPEPRERETMSALNELMKRVSPQKHLLKQLRRGANHWAASLFRTNGPGALAFYALPASVTKTSNGSKTARRFHMWCIHTCELSPNFCDVETGISSKVKKISTEFPYPTPNRKGYRLRGERGRSWSEIRRIATSSRPLFWRRDRSFG